MCASAVDRTTNVLEAYVWDSINSILDRERVSLDAFFADVDDTRLNSAWHRQHTLSFLPISGSSSRSTAPPFADPGLQRMDREGTRRGLAAASPPVPLLQLALRRFEQDEARVE